MTSSDPRWPYRLFEGVGVELEYMIVDAETLSVRPIADQLIEAETGEPGSDAERGPIAWSNELALHVIELKSQGPAKSLAEWPARFQGDLAHIDELLGRFGARLMPSGMHPWMNPDEELRLWPHECGPIYQTFHRIFDCRGHGWSNLQSTHLNLPFSNAGEFAQLHAAIRVLLPILPALTASTPVFDGRLTERKDNRLAFYSRNARRVPSVTGRVVPEPVDSPESYERDILQRIYRDLAPHDPEGTLRHEWANARGAIARFERGAIEIRILDIQECPAADLALASLIIAVLKTLTSEDQVPAWNVWSTEVLAEQLERCIDDGEDARLDSSYASALMPGSAAKTAGELWRELFDRHQDVDPDVAAQRETLNTLLRSGTLATRLAGALGPEPDRAKLESVYRELCDSLHAGQLFRAATS